MHQKELGGFHETASQDFIKSIKFSTLGKRFSNIDIFPQQTYALV